jgi:MFS family permease
LIFAVGRQLAEENVGLLQMGWVGGGFAVGAAAVSIPAGMCSDRFGRDRIAQVGAFGVVIACLGCFWIDKYCP